MADQNQFLVDLRDKTGTGMRYDRYPYADGLQIPVHINANITIR